MTFKSSVVVIVVDIVLFFNQPLTITSLYVDADYKAAKSLFSPSPSKKGKKQINYASPTREESKMHAYNRVSSRDNILSMSVDITPIPKRLVFA